MDVKKIALAAVLIFLILIIPVFAANYTLKVYTYDKNSGSALAADITVLDSAGQPVPGCSGTAVTTLQCANLPKSQYTIQAYNSNYNPLRDTFTLRSDQTRHLFLVPDTTAPSTDLKVSGTAGKGFDDTDWFVSAVTIDLTCSDSGGGCSNLFVMLDRVVTGDGSPPISLTLNEASSGLHTLTYYSEDFAGNREAVKTYNFGIDTTPPVIAGAGSGWVNVAQQFNPSCSDPESGCNSFFGYSSPTAIAQCSANPADYNVPLPVAVSTHEFWCAGAENEVGLFSFAGPFEFKVDLIPPVVDSVIVPDGAVYSPSQIYWFNATVEENEDIQTVEFDLDGQRFLPVKDNGEYGISFAGLGAGTHSVRWRAVDLAGNDHVFVRNLVIEKAPTTITLTIDGSAERQMIDTGTTFAARAELSIPSSVSITSDYIGFTEISGPSPLQTDIFFEVTGTFTITASFSGDDNYLPSTASIIIDSVERPDSESPVITVTTPVNESTVQTSKVQLDFTVSDSNPFATELSIDGGEFAPVSSGALFELVENSAHTLLLRATDIFGNIGEVLIQFTIPVLSSLQNSVVDGVNYTDENFNTASGPSVILRSNLTDSEITNSNITDSTVVRSTLVETNLTNSNVTDASLKNSMLVRSTFIGKEAEFVEAEDSFLDPGNFTGSKFKNSKIINSNVTYSSVTDSTIELSNVNGSTIVGSIFSTSYVFNNSDVHGLSGTGVNITDDVLVSGTVTYKGKEFTGPTKLSDIYSYVPPQPPTLPQGPSSGGGGGGGGGGFTPVYSVSASAEGSSFDMKEGEVKTLAVELENKGNVRLTGITLTLTEIPASWYSFESFPASLDAGQKANITIIFAPTGESSEKSGKLLVNSSQGALTEIPVSVKFTGSAPPQTTTTTTTVPGTTTTTLGSTTTTTTGPNPLTGLFTAIGSNSAAVAVVGIVLVVIGSIGWSMRKDSTKKKRAVEAEEKEAEPEGNNN